MIMAGDFRIITMMKHAIKMNNLKVYLVKNVEDNVFLWVIGQDTDNKKIKYMYPLLGKQSKKLQLEIRRVLIEKGLMHESNPKLD